MKSGKPKFITDNTSSDNNNKYKNNDKRHENPGKGIRYGDEIGVIGEDDSY